MVVGDDAGKVHDGRVERIFPGLVRGELVPDGLFDLDRHTPEADEFGADFGIVAADAGLLDFCERCVEIAGLDQRGLGPLRDGLIEHEVADVAQQTFDEKPLAVFDIAGFGNPSRHERGEDAFAPIGGEVHDVGGHAGECASDGGRGDEVADGLHADEIDGTGDGVDLLGESVEGAIDDLQEPGGDGWVDFERVGEIVHGRLVIVDHIPDANIDLRQGKDVGTGLDEFLRRCHGVDPPYCALADGLAEALGYLYRLAVCVTKGGVSKYDALFRFDGIRTVGPGVISPARRGRFWHQAAWRFSGRRRSPD